MNLPKSNLFMFSSAAVFFGGEIYAQKLPGYPVVQIPATWSVMM